MKYTANEFLASLWGDQIHRKSLLWLFFFLLFSILVFFCVLSIPISLQITKFIAGNSPILILIVFLFLPIYLCIKLNGKFGKILAISVIFTLIALPLRILWQNDIAVYAAVGGLLPWSDASGFYFNMQQFINGHNIGAYSVNSSRTIFVSTYSLLLVLTNQNLQLSIALVAYITGLSSYFLIKVVKRIWGPLYATIIFIFLFSFYRVETGILFSEPMGFAIGIFSTAFLLKYIHENKIYFIALGIFFLTVAMQIRPGALFTLPLIFVWAILTYKDNFKNQKLRLILVFSTPMLAGFFIGWCIPRIFGDQSGQNLSSLPYLLLSIVNSGAFPDNFISLYPEINKISTQTERNLALYNLAWNTFKSHPGNALRGIIHYYKGYFSNGPIGGLQFVFGESKFLTSIGFIISTYGFGVAASKIRQPIYGFIVSGIIGLLLSIPLSAYVGYRAYASTIIILILLLGLGLIWLFQLQDNKFNLQQETHEDSIISINLAAIIIFSFICFSPFIVRIFSHPIPFSTRVCNQGERLIFTQISPGSTIKIVNNQENGLSLPWVSVENFKNSLIYNVTLNFTNFFEKISPDTAVMNSYIINNDSRAWVVSNTAIFPAEAGYYYACGSYLNENSDNQIFLVRSWEKRENQGN